MGWGIGDLWDTVMGDDTDENVADYSDSMDAAAEQMDGYYGDAQESISEGYNSATSEYDDNTSIAGSREELYQRMLGNGGYSDETLNSMKSSAIESAGSAMRDTQNSINTMYGDASGDAMTAENLAKAMYSINVDKANALKDVDNENAALQEEQQTSAIDSIYDDADTMAGLDTDEALASAGLTTELAQALAELYSTSAGQELAAEEDEGLIASLI